VGILGAIHLVGGLKEAHSEQARGDGLKAESCVSPPPLGGYFQLSYSFANAKGPVPDE